MIREGRQKVETNLIEAKLDLRSRPLLCQVPDFLCFRALQLETAWTGADKNLLLIFIISLSHYHCTRRHIMKPLLEWRVSVRRKKWVRWLRVCAANKKMPLFTLNLLTTVHVQLRVPAQQQPVRHYVLQ